MENIRKTKITIDKNAGIELEFIDNLEDDIINVKYYNPDINNFSKIN